MSANGTLTMRRALASTRHVKLEIFLFTSHTNDFDVGDTFGMRTLHATKKGLESSVNLHLKRQISYRRSIRRQDEELLQSSSERSGMRLTPIT